MKSHHTNQTVLVPIFGDDISDEVFSLASSLLTATDSRLVLLQVTPDADDDAVHPAHHAASGTEPRWRRLARHVAPDRTFVEAVRGDPADEVLAEAERFHPAVIVVEPPQRNRSANAWVDRAYARMARAAPALRSVG